MPFAQETIFSSNSPNFLASICTISQTLDYSSKIMSCHNTNLGGSDYEAIHPQNPFEAVKHFLEAFKAGI